MQQCTHFQRKHCIRGVDCSFLHVLERAREKLIPKETHPALPPIGHQPAMFPPSVFTFPTSSEVDPKFHKYQGGTQHTSYNGFNAGNAPRPYWNSAPVALSEPQNPYMRLTKMESERDSLKAQVKETVSRLTVMTAHCRDVQGERDGLGAQNVSLRAQNQTHKDAHEEQSARMGTERDALNAQVGETVSQLTAMTAQCRDVQGERDGLGAQNESLRAHNHHVARMGSDYDAIRAKIAKYATLPSDSTHPVSRPHGPHWDRAVIRSFMSHHASLGPRPMCSEPMHALLSPTTPITETKLSSSNNQS